MRSQRSISKEFPYILVLPALLTILFVFFYPFAAGFKFSLYSIHFMEKASFTGFKNYIRILTNVAFWRSMKITGIYTAGYIIGVFGIGFLTALLLNCKFKGKKIAKTIVILPYAIPDLAVVLIWRWIFDYQYGVLNFFITKLGFNPSTWLLNSSLALPCLLIVTTWRLYPFHTLVLLAALQDVPKELYEVASIDGANRIQRFFYVTLPSIKGIIGILFMLTIIWCFKRFTIIWNLTGGGPGYATETLPILLYRKAFKSYDMGYAAAMGTIVILILLTITIFYFLITEERK